MMPAIGNWSQSGSECRPLPLGTLDVQGFLGERVRGNITRTIPAAFSSPLPGGFRRLLKGEAFAPEDIRYGPDSDLFKWLEGAAYAVIHDPGADLVREQMESVVEMLLQAREADGPIATYIKPERRWDTGMWHDLYCAGHLMEAAVAHHRATGDERLLQAACRWADFLLAGYEQGNDYFGGVGDHEHPEIELALVRLSRASGHERYLDFAGKIAGMFQVTPTVGELNCGAGRRHAVRVGYLLTALVELAMETGDPLRMQYVPQLWDEIAETRCYPTGGVAFRPGEIIPELPYDLPQSGRVAETCASVGMMFLGWRLHGLKPEAGHFDRIETILYNHFLGALSLDQLAVFYYNPIRVLNEAFMATDHGHSAFTRTRLPGLHSTTCCFPNAIRFLGQLPEYVFSADAEGLLVNLYTTCKARHHLVDGTGVEVSVSTEYPHDGRVAIELSVPEPTEFTLRLRIPGWCEGATVEVGGRALAGVRPGEYMAIRRRWEARTTVTLQMPMAPTVIEGHPAAAECRGQMAYRRGPLVYCLEQASIPNVALERVRGVAEGEVEPTRGEGVLEGIPTLRVPVALAADWERAELYRRAGGRRRHGEVELVPFYARSNREGPGGWLTWLPAW